MLITGAVLGAACALTACSAEGTRDPETTSLGTSGQGWATEFRQASAEASRYEKRILDDGVVTEAELADSHERVRRCLRGSGFALDWSDDGTYEISESDGGALSAEADARLERARRMCLDDFDRNVTSLFTETRRNPDKLDEADIAVDCLKRVGLVGEDYTERRWRIDYDAGSFPFDEYEDRAVQCRLDPLGLWRSH